MKRTLFASSLALIFSFTSPGAYAATYDFYVDSSFSGSPPDGSQDKPFTKISSALKEASDGQKIFIANGKYNENINLTKKIDLVGQSKSGTILEGDGTRTGIEISDDSNISNLSITNFDKGVIISPNSGVNMKSIRVFQNKSTGIEIAKGQTSDTSKVTVKNSDIEKNDKGFYIMKRKIDLSNNNVTSNRQEGIDIRQGVKGTISKNTISKNKESGIELVVGTSGLKISSNKITGNLANGISNQFYKEAKKSGDIKITKNKIRNNDDNGIQCATPSGGKPGEKYWTKSIDLANNIFSGNGKSLAGRCGFPESIKKPVAVKK